MLNKQKRQKNRLAMCHEPNPILSRPSSERGRHHSGCFTVDCRGDIVSQKNEGLDPEDYEEIDRLMDKDDYGIIEPLKDEGIALTSIFIDATDRRCRHGFLMDDECFDCDPPTCSACAGSGEGQYGESTCNDCKGKGIEK